MRAPEKGRFADRPTDVKGPPWATAWVIAAAQIASWGSTYYAFSAMIAPMHEALGWSLVQINAALSLGLLAAGLTAIPVGMWLQRGHGPVVMGGGAAASGLLLIAWASVGSLPIFYLVWTLLGCAMAAILYDAAFAVVARLFAEDARRGIALITLVAGFASTVSLPLVQLGIASIGWRATLVALGLFQMLVVAPVQYLTLRRAADGDDREHREASTATTTGHRPRVSYREALRGRAFVGLALWFTSHGGSYSGFFFQLLPMLALWRVDTATVVLTVALMGPMQVAGRFVLVSVGKSASVRVAGIAVTTALALSTLVLLFLPPTRPALALFAVLYGAGNGMMTILRGTAVVDLLGRERFAELNGLLAAPALVANAAAPLLLGLVWTLAGRPEPVLWIVLIASTVAITGILVATGVPSRAGDDDADARSITNRVRSGPTIAAGDP